MKLVMAAATVLLTMAAGLAIASEGDTRDEIRQQGYNLFLEEKFDALDRLADKYRIDKARTGSGVWKLAKLHTAILSTVACTCKDESEFIAMEKRAKRWIEHNPDSTSAHIVYAVALIKHGWWHRGEGYANEVRADAWKPFRKYIQKARDYLEVRKAMLAVDPRWYTAMLQIATDQGWSDAEFKKLLDEATERFPYYYGIYHQAIRYYSPKWYGSERKLLELAKYAVSRTSEKEGTGVYARIYWYASGVEFGHYVIIDRPVVWKRMPTAMDDVLAHFPDQWNIASFARLACTAGDRKTTRRMIARIDEKYVVRIWGSLKPTYKKCRDWAVGI
jgi:hypothetical protein